MGTCLNCQQHRGRLRRGRCNTCYRFWQRTGRDRDADRIVRTNALRLEREQANPYELRIRYQQTVAYVRQARHENHYHAPLILE